jgi:hypothetical protein
MDIVNTLDAAIPKGADIGEMIVYTSPELTMLYSRVPPRSKWHSQSHGICLYRAANRRLG